MTHPSVSIEVDHQRRPFCRGRRECECECLFYSSTYYKAVRVGEGDSGGHVLREIFERRAEPATRCEEVFFGKLEFA